MNTEHIRSELGREGQEIGYFVRLDDVEWKQHTLEYKLKKMDEREKRDTLDEPPRPDVCYARSTEGPKRKDDTLGIGPKGGDDLITSADRSLIPIREIDKHSAILTYDEASDSLKRDVVSELYPATRWDSYLRVNEDLDLLPIHEVLSRSEDGAREWIPVQRLEEGSWLRLGDLTWGRVEVLEKVMQPAKAYDFATARHEAYISNDIIVRTRRFRSNGH